MKTNLLTPAWLAGRAGSAQKLRYLLSGGATFLVEYGSFLVFSYVLQLNIYLALTLSFLLALAVGFAINHLWTFESSNRVRARLMAYTALALVNLGFNYLAVPGLAHLGVPHAVGKIVVQSCVVVWNYFLMSRWVFRADPPAGSRDVTASG